MERYDVGDRVVSNVDAQGMRRGEAFEVIERDERWVLGNCYATLTVRAEDGRELRIMNGQLLLSRAN
jgi:hypothetical protein